MIDVVGIILVSFLGIIYLMMLFIFMILIIGSALKW